MKKKKFNVKTYQRKYQKEYRLANKKEDAQRHKNWLKSNPDKLAVINKRFYEKNRVAILINQQLISVFKKDFNDCIELESCHAGITVKTLKELKKRCPLLTEEFYRQKKFGFTFKQFISNYKPKYVA